MAARQMSGGHEQLVRERQDLSRESARRVKSGWRGSTGSLPGSMTGLQRSFHSMRHMQIHSRFPSLKRRTCWLIRRRFARPSIWASFVLAGNGGL
jgi:hypothetical protein